MQPQLAARDGARRGQYLSFRIGTEDYAIDILRVQEIRRWEKVRPLPDAHGGLIGVLDMRGTIVPVVDLRVRFGAVEPAYAATTVTIVVSQGKDAGDGRGELFGAVVDSVLDVVDLDPAEVRPAPRAADAASCRCIAGLVARPQGVLVLLDLDELLTEAMPAAAGPGISGSSGGAGERR